ncbi:MAG: hypothetical protein WBS17_14280 [Candidatus Acidiferrales bacterium]
MEPLLLADSTHSQKRYAAALRGLTARRRSAAGSLKRYLSPGLAAQSTPRPATPQFSVLEAK